MDKNIANAMLLRLNKQDQIEALKSIGFTTVNENTPASDIAKYMQWSGTLLDLSLATLRIEDGEQVFFTASEWNSMSANNRSKYIRIGIRLRAECHQFIIAKSDCVDAGGNKTFKWGGYGTDLRGLKNYGSGNQGLYEVTIIQATFVIAGGIFEAEGELFPFVFFPVAFGMEIDVLQAVILTPIGGYRVIGGRVVHLQVFDMQVTAVKCSVKCTLDRCHIVTT